MLNQYRAIKARYPDMFVLYRMGDFYELFDDDAELAAKVLGITLTSRDGKVPMAGFPHQAIDLHLRKLIQAGHRAVVVDQMEDPAQAKGLVRREVTRVVTPGTVTEDELLDPRKPTHVAALAPGPKNLVGVAWVEPSSGQFWAADFPAERVADELGRIAPAECLIADQLLSEWQTTLREVLPRPVTGRPDWTFDATSGVELLKKHLRVETFAGYGFADGQVCLQAGGALVHYLRETLMSSLQHLTRVRCYQPTEFLRLDDTTRRSLELTRIPRDQSREGSLLAVIDRTVTPMGARLLHDWLLAPPLNPQVIEARLDAVGELVLQHTHRQNLRTELRAALDLYRLTTRISTGRGTPRDVAAVGKTLAVLPRVKTLLAECKAGHLQRLHQYLEPLPELRATLETALNDELPLKPDDGGVIRTGYNAELDAARKLQREGKDWLTRYQASEITRTSIPSLKVGYNSVFGYYIEITDKQSKSYPIPSNYKAKQSLKNAQRYFTAELKEFEEKIKSADENAKQLEIALFQQLRELVAAQTSKLLLAAEMLATLDVLAGLAELAATRQYCRPQLVDQPVLNIRAGRHPVLDQLRPPGTFVPNDIQLTSEGGRFWLITGPNMAGKSTFLRQAALLTLLAHVGSFVPAQSAVIGLTDRIFTRVGASDELTRGHSTFMVEMTEAANILNHATPRSLVILDEIGRGTSTYDGLSLAWAMSEHLHTTAQCRTLFATHYHELAQLALALPQLRNYYVQVEEGADTVRFLHRIAAGAAGKSYGIHVARIAGVPVSVVTRAKEVLAGLEEKHQLPAPPPALVVEPPAPVPVVVPVRKPRKRGENGPSLFGIVAPPEG
jgi:DNA mismatch repair protein MutS